MKNIIKNTILFTFLFTAFCGQILTAQTGSVGIGDTSPDEAKLVVRSADGMDALYLNNPLRFESTTESKITLWSNQASSQYGFGVSANQLNYHLAGPSDNHVFYAGGNNGDGTELMRIRGNGNVGIGTNSPNIDLAIGDTDTGLQQQGDGQLAVYTNNVERARFNSVGNFGIGTSSPSQKLDVVGSAKISSRLFLGNNPNTANTGTPLRVGTSSDGQRAAEFRNNSPFNPGSAATVRIENEGNGIALVVNNSDCRKVNGGEWLGTSDRRLKQDINEFYDGLEQIRKVRPVTFRYNDKTEFNTEEVHIGIIAQELQEIAPYMVKDKEEYLAIDGSAFKYMLINAVQEQDQIITDQQKEIDELKARLDRIEAMLKK